METPCLESLSKEFNYYKRLGEKTFQSSIRFKQTIDTLRLPYWTTRFYRKTNQKYRLEMLVYSKRKIRVLINALKFPKKKSKTHFTEDH